MSEYWLLDPLANRAEFYQLDADGHYQPVRPQDGVYRSAVVPGFWLREEWLWQEPLPSPLRTLAEITGIDPSLVESVEKALRAGDDGMMDWRCYRRPIILPSRHLPLVIRTFHVTTQVQGASHPEQSPFH